MSYFCECFQVQPGNIRSVVMEGNLCVANHHDQVLLQSDGQLLPVGFVVAVCNLYKAISGQFSKKAVDEQIYCTNGH